MMRKLAASILCAAKTLALRRWRVQVQVDPSCRLLRRFSVRFCAPVEARVYASAGRDCVLNCTIIFEARTGRVRIGDRCYIGQGTTLISRAGIDLGDDVTVAWGVTIYDHNSHSLDWRRRSDVVRHFKDHVGTAECYAEKIWNDVAAAPISIGNRVWIGFDAVLLKGITVGEGAIIGARSVVARDVEPYTIVAGNPARVVGHVERHEAMTSLSREGNS
jgi:galactoside O-acetyltransferase